MGLTCVMELSANESERLTKVVKRIRDKYFEQFNVEYLYELKYEMFENLKSKSGYAHCLYEGDITEGIDLTEEEMAIICDGGFSYFGGYSNINGRHFNVKIYTD